MAKLEKLLNQRTTQIGGKGTPRRKAIRKNQGVSTDSLLSQLDKLLVRNSATPLGGAKTVNFLSESEENKTYHVFNRPQIKYIQSAHMMVIQNANLKEEETESKTKTEETTTETPEAKETSTETPEVKETSTETQEAKETSTETQEAKETSTETPEDTPTSTTMTRVPNRKERNIKARILKINPKMKPMTNQKLDPIGYMEQGEFRWNIEEPEVYHFAKNTYIVFGPVKLGMQEQKNLTDAQQMAKNTINLDNFNDLNFEDLANNDDDEAPTLVNNEDSTTPVPTGLSEQDIQMVMEQVSNCTREQAIMALQKAGGDLVGAVLELS